MRKMNWNEIKQRFLQGTFTKLSPEFCAIGIMLAFTNETEILWCCWTCSESRYPNKQKSGGCGPNHPFPNYTFLFLSMQHENFTSIFREVYFPTFTPLTTCPLHLFSQPTHPYFSNPCSTVKPVLISTSLLEPRNPDSSPPLPAPVTHLRAWDVRCALVDFYFITWC